MQIHDTDLIILEMQTIDQSEESVKNNFQLFWENNLNEFMKKLKHNQIYSVFIHVIRRFIR